MGFRLWMIVPFVGILILWGCLAYFVYRGLHALWQKKVWAGILGAVISMLAIWPVLRIWSGSGVWNIAVLHFCIFLILIELIFWIIGRFIPEWPRIWKILRYTGIFPILCTVAIIAYGGYNIRHVVRQEYTVTTEKTIPSEGYRVAVLSDIHYSLLDNRQAMEEMAEKISAEQVDVVILCGDIVDERTSKEKMEEVFRILGQIQSNQGIYYVYGNHDTAQYSEDPPFSEAELQHAIEVNGIQILADEKVEFENGLTLIGRQDRSLGPAAPQELTDGIVESQYILLADHQPYELEAKAEAGVDLQVSGHTHNGQIFPIGLFSRILHMDDLQYGMAQVGDMTAIVTSGVTGWGYPIRTEGQSEYVIIHIEKELER